MINGHSGENYTRELLSIGLRRKLGEGFVDVPRNDVLYSSTDLRQAYGFGFSYGGRLDEEDIDRTAIEERIRRHEFDVVIFGKAGHDDWSVEQFPYAESVTRAYRHCERVFLYGGDGLQDTRDLTNPYTQHLYRHLPLGICFVRELF